MSVLENSVRTLEGCKTKFRAEIDDDHIPFFSDGNADADNALDMKIYENQDPLSCDHLALHLPKCKGCSTCDIGKIFKSHSRRRKRPKVLVSLPDATAHQMRGQLWTRCVDSTMILQ